MNAEIPKILWTLWFQGWDVAPPIVQKCKATWIEHNPNWTIHFLTSENLSDFIDLDSVLPGYKEKNLQPEALSNVIRVALLIKYGGVWADSTLYCTKPLDEWLPQCTDASGFFAFANPGPDRLLSSWFLASTHDHIIVKKWYAECVKYWSTRTVRHTYHWFHYLFGDMYVNDEVVKRIWDQTPTVSADAPHYFLPYDETLHKPLRWNVKRIIDSGEIPVFKLTFRYDEKLLNDQSVIRYFLNNEKEKVKPKTIIIVGMHRSGTSLTASLLEQSGVDIGDELLAASEGNVQGHFENVRFLDFHKKVLEKRGLDPDGWIEREIEELDAEEQQEANEIIEHCASGIWGWKEPRTTLFLNFWGTLLPDAHFLFVYRSPVEVVDSIYRRATDPIMLTHPEVAMDGWIHYNTLVLKYYEKYKERSLLMHVKSIINAYPECVEKINSAFNVSLDSNINTVFEKDLFNENKEMHLLKGKVLYGNDPASRRLYDSLLKASWHPGGSNFQQEFSWENNESEFSHLFFKQWKKERVTEAELKNIKRVELPDMMQRIEQLELEKKQLEADMVQMRKDLNAEIGWMLKSKFWKMRIAWHKVKGVFL